MWKVAEFEFKCGLYILVIFYLIRCIMYIYIVGNI